MKTIVIILLIIPIICLWLIWLFCKLVMWCIFAVRFSRKAEPPLD